MAQRENPNEIDEYVNPFCTKLDEIGSFQSYCIGHFEHEWLDALGQMMRRGEYRLRMHRGWMIQQSCATCDVNKNKAFSKCINRFVSVRLFPYLPVWLDWFCELFLIQQ